VHVRAHRLRSPVEHGEIAAGVPPAAARASHLPALHQECVALWHATPATLPVLGCHVAWHRQWRNARAAAALVDLVSARLADYPLDPDARVAWRTALRRHLLAFGEERLGWPAAYRDTVFDESFCQTAAAFAAEARRFDPALSLADLGQALRNVWVGNSLQILAGDRVRLTPALFAYSMLYPATDNVLDAGDVPPEVKRGFNERLGYRLAGEVVSPQGSAETRVWTLLDTIEGEFPHARYPPLWGSLRDIHHAQVASLQQQRRPWPSAARLLDLTIAKGGASVRADMHVIAGQPDREAERTAFFYGVFLQMLDDLQDIGSDLEAGHETLFTRAARSGGLDALTRRLAQFIDRVVALHAVVPGTAPASCSEVIRRNCLTLLVGVVAREPQRFGRDLRQEIERQWPIRLGAMRRLLRRAQHHLARTSTQLQERHGTDSVLELLSKP
jgi:hypothetical protein